jgi:hypothetical protein
MQLLAESGAKFVQGLEQSLVQGLTFQNPKIHQVFANFLSLNDKINTKFVFLTFIEPLALEIWL